MPGVHRAGDLQADGLARRITLDLGLDNRCGGGKLAQRPANPAAHRLLVGLRVAREPGRNAAEGRGQALALPLEHDAFLLRPRGVAAEEVFFARRSVGVRDEAHLQPGLRLLPVGLFQERRFMVAQPGLRRADQITRLAFAQERDVRLVDHAAIHGPDALGDTVFGLHGCDDLLTSAWLPAKTSKDSGRPSGVQTRPMQTCLQSPRLSRE